MCIRDSLTTDASGLDVTVDVVEELGADAYVYGTPYGVSQIGTDGDDSSHKPFLARVDGRRPPKRGDKSRLVPKPGHIHLFDAATGVRLND